MSVCLSASLPACLSVCLSVCLPACLSVCLPVFHLSFICHTCLCSLPHTYTHMYKHTMPIHVHMHTDKTYTPHVHAQCFIHMHRVAVHVFVFYYNGSLGLCVALGIRIYDNEACCFAHHARRYHGWRGNSSRFLDLPVGMMKTSATCGCQAATGSERFNKASHLCYTCMA